jgi:putative peptidoglycan lipid II flippase
MDTTNSILRSAKSFFAGTLLSRFSGLLRDMVMAACFGSSIEISAFMVSYRLANLFRRLLGEGNLQASFIPHFIALKEEGPKFYRDTLFSMGLLLLLIVACLEILLWGCRYWVSPDWLEIIELCMWMTPGLFFICLYALSASLLQCQKKYFLPAVAPVAFNFIWIGSTLLFKNVQWLSLSITLAFAGQWLITVFEERKLLTLKEWLQPKLFSSAFKALLKPLGLGITGIGAVQLNSALDTIFARMADLKGPTFLWFAIRLEQLPLALFGVALSGALLPPLARAEKEEQRHSLLQIGLKQSAAFMFLATFGIFALAKVGVNLLYGRGDFTVLDVKETVYCLWGYGVGLIPSVFIMLLASYYYAQKNYRTPALASLISVCVNLLLNAFFVFVLKWGAVSIALATSLSAFVNMAFLSKGAFRGLGVTFFKMGLGSILGAALTLCVENLWLQSYPRDLFAQLIQMAMLSVVYLASSLGLMYLLGVGRLSTYSKEA